MPSRRSTPKVLHRAGELRNDATPEEKLLWAHLRLLRNDDIRFRRQHAIGQFIADFCCIKKKLIIELDGGHHRKQESQDKERTTYLEAEGYKVIRFWNNQVMNDVDGVIRAIVHAIKTEDEA